MLENSRDAADFMFRDTDLNNNGVIDDDETSQCLVPFFDHFLTKKLQELGTKIATARHKDWALHKSLKTTVFISKKVESFIEGLEKIALDLEVTPYDDQIDQASPRKERDLL